MFKPCQSKLTLRFGCEVKKQMVLIEEDEEGEESEEDVEEDEW